ncbi:MAG TPA: DUF2232 domain-containing protein [Clostridia bacterium]|nr:DUF2232 domain-containing protein [Clostridia bacterium]
MNIRNVILGTLGVVLIALASVLIPILGVVLAGIPIILLLLKEKGSIHESILTLSMAVVMTYFIFGLFNAIFIAIYGVLTSLVLSYTYYRETKPLKAQLLIGGSVLLSFTMVLYLINMGTDLHISEFFRESFFSSEDMIESMGLLENSEMDLNMVINQILTIIPFIMVLISFVNGIMIFHGNRLVMQKNDKPVVKMENFSDFKLPMHFIYGITFILVLSYLSGLVGMIEFNTISLNIILVLIYVFAFQGASILFYYLDQRNINNFLKGLILVLLIVFQAMFILSIIGWLDMIFDFRRIKNKDEK